MSGLKCKHITLLVTNRCDLKCRNCYVNQGAADFPQEYFEVRVLEPLKRLGGSSIGFSGGEPLLHPSILQMIEKSAGSGLVTSLVTNGMSLDTSRIQALEQAGLNRLQISLDGARKDSNDTVRGEGVFEKVTQEVLPLLHYSKIKVTLVATPNPWLLKELDEYISLAVRLKIKYIYFRRCVSGGVLDDEKRRLYREFLVKILKLQKEYARNLTIMCGDPLIVLERDITPNKKMFAGCAAGVTSLAVNESGKIMPCTRLPVELGNVSEDKLETIWKEHEVLKKLRFRCLEGQCGDCSYQYLCGGCRADAYFYQGNYLADDPLCSLYEF